MILAERESGAERREGRGGEKRGGESKPREVLALRKHTGPGLHTCVV